MARWNFAGKAGSSEVGRARGDARELSFTRKGVYLLSWLTRAQHTVEAMIAIA